VNQQILSELISWFVNDKCSSPSPHFVKQATLSRHSIPNSTWIETGTYLGSTTAFLAHLASHVHTIEPSNELAETAKNNCSNFSNITFHHGTSEDKLEAIINSITGNCCFWLDGHYSGGNTFKGETETPVRGELKIISRHVNRLGKIVVLIDDIRCSHIDKSNYPSLDYYVNWSRANGFDWIIEHDIFVAKSDGLRMY